MPKLASGVIDLRLVQLEDHPIEALEACRAAFSACEATHSQNLYQTVAFLARFIATLERAPASEHAFRTDEFWEGSHRVLKSKRLALLATRFVLGARRAEGTLYEQARSYAKVVEFFCQSRADSYDVVARLERRGIYGLLDELKEAEQHEEDASRSSDEEDQNPSSADGSDSDDGSGERGSRDLSDSDSDDNAGGGARPEDGSDAIGSRRWWQAFLAHCKAIQASGNVPVVISATSGDLDDLKRRSRRRNATMSLTQETSSEGWLHFTCESIERTAAHGQRSVPGIGQPVRLFSLVSPARGGPGGVPQLAAQRSRT